MSKNLELRQWRGGRGPVHKKLSTGGSGYRVAEGEEQVYKLLTLIPS